jgi:hypothetical protein
MDEQKTDGLKITFDLSVSDDFVLSPPSLVPDYSCISLACLCYNMNSSVILVDSFLSNFHVISQIYNRKFILLFYVETNIGQ